MRSTTYDPAGTVSEGIAVYEQAVVGGRDADSYGRYRRLADGIRGAMRPGDTCTLAFAADLDRRDGARWSAPAFVAVLDDRVVVAWRRGRLRSRSDAVTISRRSITAVRAGAGAADPERLLLTIAGEQDVVLVACAGTRSVLHDVLGRSGSPTAPTTDNG